MNEERLPKLAARAIRSISQNGRALTEAPRLTTKTSMNGKKD
jgi:hypothetical protein